MKDEYLFVPLDQEYPHDSELCGKARAVTINLLFTENTYHYHLSAMTKQRKQEVKLYLESELWYLL